MSDPIPIPVIPVICDRCRAEGAAGDGSFSGIAEILDFEPVPRRARADGWGPDYQRAFIAALAITGAPPRAARAIGKHAFGAEQLRKAKGGRSFAAAWDAALDIYRDRELARLKDNLADLASEQEGRVAPPPDEVERSADAARIELLGALLGHYLKRLEMERAARLAGRVVEADFYVRQVTVLEVCLDLVSGDAWKLLADLRVDDPPFDRRMIVEVAETPMSRLLDEARREQWAEAGEPERPPLPGPGELADRGRFSLGVQEGFGGPDFKERQRAREADYAAAARAQLEWEEKARTEAAACLTEPAEDQSPG